MRLWSVLLLTALIFSIFGIRRLRPFARLERPASESFTRAESLGALGYYTVWTAAIVLYIALFFSVSQTLDRAQSGLGNWLLGSAFFGLPGLVIGALYLKVNRDYKESLKEIWAQEGAETSEQYWTNKMAREEREAEERYQRWIEWAGKPEQDLQRLADDVLFLFDGMPRVKVQLAELSSDRLGQYCGGYGDGFAYQRRAYNQRIEIDLDYCKNASTAQIERVIKHELVHAWIDWTGVGNADPHGTEFQMKAKEIGL